MFFAWTNARATFGPGYSLSLQRWPRIGTKIQAHRFWFAGTRLPYVYYTLFVKGHSIQTVSKSKDLNSFETWFGFRFVATFEDDFYIFLPQGTASGYGELLFAPMQAIWHSGGRRASKGGSNWNDTSYVHLKSKRWPSWDLSFLSFLWVPACMLRPSPFV